jgi:RNA polymerase sigma factor (sigma-70 family)
MARFPTTSWSLIVASIRRPTAASHEALTRLCQAYWFPLYAHVRKHGYDADQAQDLTQEFFTRLLERRYLAQFRRERGRFRSFLIGALKHFLANEHDRAQAQKRGGRLLILPLEFDAAEGRYSVDPGHNVTPEKVFERQWALTLLDRALSKLKTAEHFDQLKPCLTANGAQVSYRQLAAQLGTSEGAVKVAVHRLRRRFRDLLHAEIAQTVENPDQIDDEIRYLFSVLSG